VDQIGTQTGLEKRLLRHPVVKLNAPFRGGVLTVGKAKRKRKEAGGGDRGIKGQIEAACLS